MDFREPLPRLPAQELEEPLRPDTDLAIHKRPRDKCAETQLQSHPQTSL